VCQVPLTDILIMLVMLIIYRNVNVFKTANCCFRNIVSVTLLLDK